MAPNPGQRPMSATLVYYNQNAQAFFADTVDVDMSALHDRFLATLSAGGLVLDAGCGSGRDVRAFLERDFRVCAFDASSALAQLAATHTGLAVVIRTFAEVCEQSCYDGIWACASLLHLPEADIPAALAQLWDALKPGGTFYMSFSQPTLQYCAIVELWLFVDTMIVNTSPGPGRPVASWRRRLNGSCRIRAMKYLRLSRLAGLTLTGLMLNHAAVAAPLLRCHVTYAGSTQTLETGPVGDPYPVASVAIGERFRFKAVMVGTEGQVTYIKLYAYFETPQQPLLIQATNYLPPFAATTTPYPLTGEQHLYAGTMERELLYHCTLEGVQP